MKTAGTWHSKGNVEFYLSSSTSPCRFASKSELFARAHIIFNLIYEYTYTKFFSLTQAYRASQLLWLAAGNSSRVYNRSANHNWNTYWPMLNKQLLHHAGHTMTGKQQCFSNKQKTFEVTGQKALEPLIPSVKWRFASGRKPQPQFWNAATIQVIIKRSCKKRHRNLCFARTKRKCIPFFGPLKSFCRVRRNYSWFCTYVRNNYDLSPDVNWG